MRLQCKRLFTWSNKNDHQIDQFALDQMNTPGQAGHGVKRSITNDDAITRSMVNGYAAHQICKDSVNFAGYLTTVDTSKPEVKIGGGGVVMKVIGVWRWNLLYIISG